MRSFHQIEGILHSDEQNLEEIAKNHGTPSYIYSGSHIEETIHRLQNTFKSILPAENQPLIAYACKANSNLAILKLMATNGLGTDIVSGGELQRALKADIPTNKIVFSGVGKTDNEIIEALTSNILQINVESEPELKRIAYLAEQKNLIAPIALRLNPDVEAEGTHDKISTGKAENKFGMSRPEVETLYEWAHNHPHLAPRGISVHIGSQLTTLRPFRKAYKIVAEVAQGFKDKGFPLESLDIGGGLGVVYKDETPVDLDEYARILKEIIYPLGTQVIIEPGRFLTAEAGLLLTRVIYVKEGDTRKHVIVDAAMNDLMRPSLYDAWHNIQPVDNTKDRANCIYDIVGPVCETGDTFAKGRELPEVKAGELLAIMTSGAYGFVMASQYNTRPIAAEILTYKDKTAVIRRRDTLEDILEKEKIPDWLT